MNLNVILEVAITLTFLYSLLSIMVSSINEIVVYAMKKRGKFLYWALEEVFKDQFKNKDYAALLLRHPLIDRLKKTEKSLPFYIGGVQFSEALIDVFIEEYDNNKLQFSKTPNADGTYSLVPIAPLVHDAFSKFKASVDMMKNSDVKKLLGSFLNGTDDYDKLKINIQNWYKDYMDRVNGWYKTDLQRYIFIISLFVAVGFNVNTIKVIREMSNDKVLREQLVMAAEKYVDSGIKHADTTKATDQNYREMIKTIKIMNDSIVGMGFPIGWDFTKKKCCEHTGCTCEAGEDCDTTCVKNQCYKNVPAKLDSADRKRLSEIRFGLLKLTTDSVTVKALKLEEKKLIAKEKKLIADAEINRKKDCHCAVDKRGWFKKKRDWCASAWKELHQHSFWETIIGWIISAFALSFGAPFWFDLLSKLVNLRKAGAKPDDKPTV